MIQTETASISQYEVGNGLHEKWKSSQEILFHFSHTN